MTGASVACRPKVRTQEPLTGGSVAGVHTVITQEFLSSDVSLTITLAPPEFLSGCPMERSPETLVGVFRLGSSRFSPAIMLAAIMYM